MMYSAMSDVVMMSALMSRNNYYYDRPMAGGQVAYVERRGIGVMGVIGIIFMVGIVVAVIAIGVNSQ